MSALVPMVEMVATGRNGSVNDHDGPRGGSSCVSSVELMNALLANAIDLQTQTKQALWNVSARSSSVAHALLDQVAQGVASYVGSIAERVVAIGGVAQGTARMVAQRSTLPEYPTDVSTECSHVLAVAAAFTAFGKSVRTAAGACESMADPDSSGLFQEIAHGTEQWISLLRSQSGTVRGGFRYSMTDDLPQPIREQLPQHAQDIFRQTFNQASAGGRDEAACGRAAWAAVKRTYEKLSGRWVPRDRENW